MTTHGDLVEAWLADPTPSALEDLREVVRSAANFDPDLSVDTVAGPLMERGAYDEAVAAVQALMPGAMLSPSAHGALAEALRRTGRTDAAQREASLARASMRAILATGDGTAARPWSVLRVSDEYDVLRSLRKRPREQSVDQRGDRLLDHHVCDDGSEVWFDVTGLLATG